MATVPPVSDPRFDPNYSESPEAKKPRGFWANCLIGCLITLVILFVLGIIAAYWVSLHWRGWAADAGSNVMKQMVAQSELADQEKADMNVQIDRLANAFRNNQISADQAQKLIENLT